jgi:hypothetical protein
MKKQGGRHERANPDLDPLTFVRLLWRTEVVELLRDFGCEARVLRAPGAIAYPAFVYAVSKLGFAQLSGLHSRAVHAGEIMQHFRDTMIRAYPAPCHEIAGA